MLTSLHVDPSALKELEGICLSSGTFLSGVVEKTKDGKDYKVVFQKGARAVAFEQATGATAISASPTEAMIARSFERQP